MGVDGLSQENLLNGAKSLISINDIGTATRASTTGRLIESGKSCLSQKTCLNDAIRLWNTLPLSVTKCDTFSQITEL